MPRVSCDMTSINARIAVTNMRGLYIKNQAVIAWRHKTSILTGVFVAVVALS